jgi:hypothetical protein
MFRMNESSRTTMSALTSLAASDLFVLLERAYRKRARDCESCLFSLPYRTDAADAPYSNWSIVPSSGCCGLCRHILEDVVAEHQASYRLAA